MQKKNHRQLDSTNKVKVFVLYLMRNIGHPISYTVINDIVMQNNYVNFVDFAVSFGEMIETGLLSVNGKNEENEELFTVSDKGVIIAEQLAGRINKEILDNSVKAAIRYMDFKSRNLSCKTETTQLRDGCIQLTMSLYDGQRMLFSTTIMVDSMIHADQMKERFTSHPEEIYKSIIALYSGNVDYLFSDDAK